MPTQPGQILVFSLCPRLYWFLYIKHKYDSFTSILILGEQGGEGVRPLKNKADSSKGIGSDGWTRTSDLTDMSRML